MNCPCCGGDKDWIKYWGHNSLADVLRAYADVIDERNNNVYLQNP